MMSLEQKWRYEDPIKKFIAEQRDWLTENGITSEEDLLTTKDEVDAAVEDLEWHYGNVIGGNVDKLLTNQLLMRKAIDEVLSELEDEE